MTHSTKQTISRISNARNVDRNPKFLDIALVEKEAAKTHYWLELSEASGLGTEIAQQWLFQEANELVAIFTRIGKTSKART